MPARFERSRLATLLCFFFICLLAGAAQPRAPFAESDFLRLTFELSRLDRQAAAGQKEQALAGYSRFTSSLAHEKERAGIWQGMLNHLERYAGYQASFLRQPPHSPGDAIRRQVEAAALARARRKPPMQAVQIDSAFCLNLAAWWTQAEQACNEGRLNDAARIYEAILGRLDAAAPINTQWAHPEYHARRYTLTRSVLVADRLRRLPGIGMRPAALPQRHEVDFPTSWDLPVALEIGTRITAYTLMKPRHNYFLGSINRLDALQDLWPYKVFCAVQLNPWLGIEATWDKVAAKTVTDFDRHTDGIIRAAGPILTLQASYPNSTIFTPFAGLGVAWLFPKFDADPVWHNGFGRLYSAKDLPWSQAVAEYEAWVAAGSPEWPNDGYQRKMDLSGGLGFTALAGCNVQIADNFSAELMLRYMYLDVDVEYYTLRYGQLDRHHDSTSFPLSHLSVGLGLRYRF